MVTKIKNPTKFAAFGFISIPLLFIISGGYMILDNNLIGFIFGILGMFNYLFVIYGYENKE